MTNNLIGYLFAAILFLVFIWVLVKLLGGEADAAVLSTLS